MSIRDITPKLGYQTQKLLDMTKEKKPESMLRMPDFSLREASEFNAGRLYTGEEALFNHIERFPFNKPFPLIPEAMVKVNLKLNAENERFNETPLSFAWHRRSLIFHRIKEEIHRVAVRSEVERQAMVEYFERELRDQEVRIQAEFLKQKIHAEHQTAVHKVSAEKARMDELETRNHSIEKSDAVRDRTLAALAMKMLASDIKYQLANQTEMKLLKKKRWVDFNEAMRHVVKDLEAQAYIKERSKELIKPIYGPQELRVMIRADQLKSLFDRISDWRKQIDVKSFAVKESHMKIQEGRHALLENADRLLRQDKEHFRETKVRNNSKMEEQVQFAMSEKRKFVESNRVISDETFRESQRFVLNEKKAETIRAALQFSLISDWVRMAEMEKTDRVEDVIGERFLLADEKKFLEDERRDFKSDLKRVDIEKSAEHEKYLAKAGENKFDNLRFGPGRSDLQVYQKVVVLEEVEKREAEEVRDYKAANERSHDLRLDRKQQRFADMKRSEGKFDDLLFGAEKSKNELALRKLEQQKEARRTEDRFEGLRLGAGLSETEKKIRKLEEIKENQYKDNLFESLRFGSDQEQNLKKSIVNHENAQVSMDSSQLTKERNALIGEAELKKDVLLRSTQDAKILEKRLSRLNLDSNFTNQAQIHLARGLEPLSLSDHLKLIERLKSDSASSSEKRLKGAFNSYAEASKEFSQIELENAVLKKA